MATPGTDQSGALVRRMAAGDREAFAAFYDAYAPLAFGLIRRVVGDVDEAADVLQEVFLELWRAAPTYDPRRGTPEAWVTIRARSRGIDRVRSVRRRDEMISTPVAESAVIAVEATNPVAEAEEREMVRGALGALPANQREVLELAYFRGLSQSEISRRLGQPLGTVKTRMRLGMDRLRTLMGARP
jgi:RNA polymerase sigma-70 factor (ECF subfamily)